MRALEGFEEEEDEVKEEETANGVKTHLALCLVSNTFDVGLASAIVTVAVAAAAMAMATKSILRPKNTKSILCKMEQGPFLSPSVSQGRAMRLRLLLRSGA